MNKKMSSSGGQRHDHAEVEKRILARENGEDSSLATTVAKKRKVDSPVASESMGRSSSNSNSNSNSNTANHEEIESALALASLAGLAGDTKSRRLLRMKEDATKNITEPTTSIHQVQNASSWEETRSPKACQDPAAPDERAPGSPTKQEISEDAAEEPGTPESSDSSKRVHFANGTKQEDAPSTPSRSLQHATPRRLMMPSPKTQKTRQPSTFMPRHQPPGRGGPEPYYQHAFSPASFRTPPSMPYYPMNSPHSPHPGYQHPRHAPPTPPGAGMQPWFHSPAMAASMTSRINYPPPRGLYQPALMHPENQWICDFCNVASFSSYEEACVHEDLCKKVQRTSAGGVHCPSSPYYGAPQFGSPYGGPSFRHSGRSIGMSRSCSSEEGSNQMMPEESLTPADSDTWHSGTMSLALGDSDAEWLSELNCYIRNRCVEAFSATEDDVATSSKRGKVSLQQVGIRCKFCVDTPCKEKAAAAVSFPTSVNGIYESVKRWQRVHLEVCESVPQHVRAKIDTLARSSVWVPTTRQYWNDSARAMGLVDTTDGIRFGVDPKEIACKINSDECLKRPMVMGNPRGGMVAHRGPSLAAMPGRLPPPMSISLPTTGSEELSSIKDGAYIVGPQDMEMIPVYVYFLMRQVEPCRFTEADRFVARSKGPVGYPGFQCRHCKGHAGLGKYFPVSAKSLSTNSTSQNIHAHVLKCRKVPEAVKDRLVQLKIEKGRSPRLEPGWRKVFFDKVWERLHGTQESLS